MTKRNKETTDLFISLFKNMIICKIHLPEIEDMKMAQKCLDIGLRKKFQGLEFRDFYELAAKVTKYEELLMKKVTGERSLWESIIKR